MMPIAIKKIIVLSELRAGHRPQRGTDLVKGASKSSNAVPFKFSSVRNSRTMRWPRIP